MRKIFLDTNIILDLLTAREPHNIHAEKLFALIENKKLKAYISAQTVSDTYYILRKHIGKNKAINSLKMLTSILSILSTNEKIILEALDSDFKDFEDAIQYNICKSSKIGILITRNIKDFKVDDIIICSAEEFYYSYLVQEKLK